MTDEEEPIEVRQESELAVLQSIYGDNVVDNREAVAWKIWRPLDVLVTLEPLHDSNVKGVHCSVTLHFKCCTDYPNKPPKVSVHKLTGLSIENSKILLKKLEAEALRRLGEVCIYEMAQLTQQFLYEHNRPTLSFYEERLIMKSEEEKLKQHKLKVKEEEERKKIKEEIQKHQEMLRETTRQRTRSSSNNQDQDRVDGQGDTPELVYYADEKASPVKKVSWAPNVDAPCNCKNKLINIIRVTQRNNKKVYIGNCLGHSSNDTTTFLAIDDSGERLIAKRWILPSSNDFQTRQKQLSSIQTDLKKISTLKNESLVPYIAMEICKDGSKKVTKQEIYLFRNYVLGTSLKVIKKKLCGFSEQYGGMKLLRHVGLGLLHALKALHSIGFSHGDVRPENVYLDDSGKVKLVGIDFDNRFTEMLNADSSKDKQDKDNNRDRYTPAQDILAAGRLLLSLVVEDCNNYEVPRDLSTTAQDFFARCLTDDEHTQWSAEELIKHAFLEDTPPKAVVNNKNKTHEDNTEGNKILQGYIPVADAHSRLSKEFEMLSWIGKGAFGDVIKVKNRLDGAIYAIKRIKLNPENVQLNKKLTREVKLLSRLNHEHVVRYNNAWIESTIEVDQDDHSDDDESEPPSVKKHGDSLQGVVAKLGQAAKVEWSISEKPVQQNVVAYNSDESDDEDEADEANNAANAPPNQTVVQKEESSSGIAFEAASNPSQTIPSEAPVVEKAAVTSNKRERVKKILYIHMEFCEKHTLRHAIDGGLYKESYRAWRFFREIVTGLAHVHQRGMIHRDLKPVNIFVNSKDHIKIGDFGLATKAFNAVSAEEKIKPEEIGGSHSGQVGTALYVAPEIVKASSKVIYSQKVDIYSLGIILFELFHPPLNTGMERIQVLNKLRSPEIILPESFEEENVKRVHLIRWLLNHDPSQRPTCLGLLSSEYVPRTVPQKELSGLMAATFNDKRSTRYKRLIDTCLDQTPSKVEDSTYHDDIYNRTLLKLLSNLKQAVIKIFITHGATEFSTPLMCPRAQRWDELNNSTKVMTSSGFVCHLPRDLRLPFARYTAYKNEKYMRRYAIDRVYRDVYAQLHPDEIIDCAFDIVTPSTDTLWPDAELLVVASRAVQACNLKPIIRLNHTELLNIMVQSCAPLDKHDQLYDVLANANLGRIRGPQVRTILTSLGVTETNQILINKLLVNLIPVAKLKEAIHPLIKDSKWAKNVDIWVSKLEALCNNAIALGCECPLIMGPFLAANATQYSGIFWQMSAPDPTNDKKIKKVAVGGRYDPLVEEFREVVRLADTKTISTTSVGFSMSLEVMAKMLEKASIDVDAEVPVIMKSSKSSLVCVCQWGVAGTEADGQAATRRAQLARELWAAGHCCCTWSGAAVDAHELTRAKLTLCEDNSSTRLVCWDGVREHNVSYMEVLDFVKQKLNPESVRSPERTFPGSSRTVSWSENEKTNSISIAVTFITASDRMTKNTKRNLESQIITRVTNILVNLGLQLVLSKIRVNVLALSCEGSCVTLLAAELSAPLKCESLERSFSPVLNAYPKWRSVLDDAYNELYNLVKQNNQSRSDEIQLFAVYSIPDSVCRLIT